MTNREAHEEAAGMNLSDSFFAISGIDPNAEYCGPGHNKQITITSKILGSVSNKMNVKVGVNG